MHSRRVFLKLLFGLGAFILPWTSGPSKLKTVLEAYEKLPKAKLYTPLPPSQSLSDDLQAESLNRTAMEDIIALTAPEMEGRRAGLVGEGRASQYLVKELSKLRLKPMGDRDGSFAHVFTIPPVKESVIGERLTFTAGPVGDLRTPSMNLLAGLEGEKDDEIILLSAHYDHLGIYQGQVYAGANDNASGVGCVLEVLRRLIRDNHQENRIPKKTIVVAFWSAEEMGYVGSRAFISSPSFPLDRIKAVINVDTIGNGSLGEFALWSSGTTHLAIQAVQDAAAAMGVRAQYTPNRGHNSDQSSFTQAGIPAVTLMARDWLQNNHSPQDTAENINPEQLGLATEIVYRAIKSLAEY